MPHEIPLTPLFICDGAQESQNVISHSPFTVGRLPDRDLVLAHPYVSRKHAEILYQDGAFTLVDLASRHGTFVNGIHVQRQRLAIKDVIHFGSPDGPFVRFGVDMADSTSTIRELLGHIQSVSTHNGALEKLRWFLEAARRLNDVGAVDQILTSLVETTLDLTKVERGYVFLCNEANELALAVGLNSEDQLLTDDATLSRTAIAQAIHGAGEYIVTDTLSAETGSPSESMVAQSIRTVICIPLRSRHGEASRSPDKRSPDARSPGTGSPAARGDVMGVLYLDSRLNPGKLTEVDHDLLRTIASEAAALVDNARLALAEERARRDREELNVAASIQQGLMAVQIPALSYAQIVARSIPCKEIGGDFYDVVVDRDCIYLVVADVSGKGVSAALLGSTLQGMVYSQLLARQPLDAIAEIVNRYICAKDIGKYATMVILKLSQSGQLEYINCGQVHPLLCTPAGVQRLSASNLPVGLIETAAFHSHVVTLEPGTRVLLVTDGVTEAEDCAGDFFGDQRLEQALCSSQNMEEVFESVQAFCGIAPANDDFTMLEVLFR